ncbi:MAG: polymer-forming cytoskeletal protein [Treponema sp.]|jgi:cytoskeletal protein CcmA (bactofilin family)|nr:polymer-forming cytoskeletal protein [Treponema sp.]
MAHTDARRKFKIRRRNEFALNTIIGPESFVQGDMETGGFTRIDGGLRGNLHAKGKVVVGENARMRSSIIGTAVTIGGVVDGNILATERIIVLPSALIMGDIITRRIEAHDGCVIHGKIRVIQGEESWERAAAAYQHKRSVRSPAEQPRTRGSRTEGSHG